MTKPLPAGQRKQPPNWSASEDCELRGYVEDGCTGTEIALLMGVTRNAVVNRCARLGIKIGEGKTRSERTRAGIAYAKFLREIDA